MEEMLGEALGPRSPSAASCLAWRDTNAGLRELPLQAGSLLGPGTRGHGQELCQVGAGGLAGKGDIGGHQALSEAATGARQGAAALSPRSLPLGSALLLYLLGRKVWEGPKGKEGFYFQHLFCSLQTNRDAGACRSLWFGLAAPPGSRWMWFGCRGPGVGAGDLDAVLCPGTGLAWP